MKVLFLALGQENLGQQYLSAALKQAGHTTALAFDSGLFRDGYQHFDLPFLARSLDSRGLVREQILREDPDMVCLTAMSSTFRWALEHAAWIKAHTRALVGLGGAHPTVAPEAAISSPHVDFLGLGECEEALPEFCDALERGDGSHRNIASIWVREGGVVHRNPVRPAVADLDTLPMADKALYARDMNLHRKYRIATQRGCPNSCTFCGNAFYLKFYKGRYLRRRSPENVMRELRLAKARYEIRWVAFYDDIFARDREWLDEFLPRFKEEIGVGFSCNGYPDEVDDRLLEQLHDAGCRFFEIGVQSADARTRRKVLNRKESNEDVERVVAACNRLDIFLQVDHIFGLPGETEGDRRRSLAWYNEIRPHRVGCFQLALFPGTQLYQDARKQGRLPDAEAWRIETGGLQSYHEGGALDPGLQEGVRAAEICTRLIRLLPRPAMRWLLESGRYLRLGRLPLAVAHALDLAASWHPGNNVMFTYLDQYQREIRKLLRWRLGR